MSTQTAQPRLHDIEPFGEADERVLAEVAEIFRRYDVTNRYGIALRHGHPGLGAGQIYAEASGTKPDTRELTPVPADTPLDGYTVTQMAMGQDGWVPLQLCVESDTDHH